MVKRGGEEASLVALSSANWRPSSCPFLAWLFLPSSISSLWEVDVYHDPNVMEKSGKSVLQANEEDFRLPALHSYLCIYLSCTERNNKKDDRLLTSTCYMLFIDYTACKRVTHTHIHIVVGSGIFPVSRTWCSKYSCYTHYSVIWNSRYDHLSPWKRSSCDKQNACNIWTDGLGEQVIDNIVCRVLAFSKETRLFLVMPVPQEKKKFRQILLFPTSLHSNLSSSCVSVKKKGRRKTPACVSFHILPSFSCNLCREIISLTYVVFVIFLGGNILFLCSSCISCLLRGHLLCRLQFMEEGKVRESHECLAHFLDPWVDRSLSFLTFIILPLFFSFIVIKIYARFVHWIKISRCPTFGKQADMMQDDASTRSKKETRAVTAKARVPGNKLCTEMKDCPRRCKRKMEKNIYIYIYSNAADQSVWSRVQTVSCVLVSAEDQERAKEERWWKRDERRNQDTVEREKTRRR